MARNTKYTKEDLKLAVKKADVIISELCSASEFKDKLFKYGNLKLEDNIARLSLPEIITCTCACKGCYAMKMLYPNTRVARLINLLLIMYAIRDTDFERVYLMQAHKELTKHLNKCIKKNQKPMFRFHDSGDIFNEEYLKLIIEMAIMNPRIQFYTYTKNQHIFNLYEDVQLPNFNIVSSFVKGHVNYFDLIGNFDKEFKVLKDIVEKLKQSDEQMFFCNYNFEKFEEKNPDNYNTFISYLQKNKKVVQFVKEHLDCGVCDACSKYKYTVFLKH
jgi:hypothetical protein